jgi:hypothetical protein
MTWEFFRYADLRILPISFCFLRLYVCSQTHVPHDGTDTPLAQYEALLDPIRLLSTIPRTLGTSTMGAADNVHAMQKDSMLRRKSMLAAQTGRSNSILIESGFRYVGSFSNFGSLFFLLTGVLVCVSVNGKRFEPSSLQRWLHSSAHMWAT